MQTGNVTTPFGRRSISLALVRQQKKVAEIKAGKSADKWKVFRDVSAAREQLGLQSSSLAVLDALLSFYPDSEMRQDAQLVVFPSNAQLSLRAHGMPGSTLRRHLAMLVDSGLIQRRDSANGKRYVRKDQGGTVEVAYGFDISPLLARAEELAVIAQEVITARAAFRRVKENLTICRRDVRKLISAAIEEGADGDWQALEDVYVAAVGRLPRLASARDATAALDEMETLKAEVLNRLEEFDKSRKSSANDAQIEQHIQNSNTEYTNEFEPRSEKEQDAGSNEKREKACEAQRAFPLSVVLKACPQMVDYGPAGEIRSWKEMMTAGVVVRSMLGISPSAYQEACEVMGAENAAVAVACILERSNLINSPGGYLRNLTQRAGKQEFSIGPMMMAALRANGAERIRAV